MSRKVASACPDCAPSLDRRSFIHAVSGAAAAGVVAPLVLTPATAQAAPTPSSAAETTAGRLFASLSDQQKETICFPFEHELRSKISANWHVTKPTIESDFFTKDQQKLVDEILRGITSPDGYERIQRQTEYDDGGVGAYSIALFGSPGTGKFQWLMTGRHLTMRADGDCVPGAAFGGPIIYGHGEESPKDNLFYYQTTQANEVFKALDAKQNKQALLAKAPAEAAVELQGGDGKFPGISVGDLSSDQQELVEKTLKVLLAPYRSEDVEEVMTILKTSGGLGKLHMAFYQQGDLKDDRVWDIWRVEGPSFVWHFRGAPHVHAYINIAQKG